MPYVGKRLPSSTNRLLVIGAGTYVDDVQPPGCLFMAVARSPHPRARMVSADLEQARDLPGVVTAVWWADLETPGQPLRPLPHQSREIAGGTRVPRVFPLAMGQVRYVGEPVAAVVAEDRFTAAAALDLIEIEYDILPPVLDRDAAMDPGAPLVRDDWPDNVMLDLHVETGDVPTAFAQAYGTASGELLCDRLAPSPLEPRGMIASWDARRAVLTCRASTQTPHPLRDYLAEVLGLPASSVHLTAENVGGGFGAKLPLPTEEVLTCLLSKRLGRPVKWIEERWEQLTSLGHSRDIRCRYDVAFAQDGLITGLRVSLVADLGAPSEQIGRGMAVNTYMCMPGPYRVDNLIVDLKGVVTNKPPWQAYRGFGKEAAAFFMDRIVDHVAAGSGVERPAVRLRNFIPADAMPASLATGPIIDSGNYAACLRKVLDIVDYPDFRRLQEQARAEGRLIGIGFGQELTPEGVSLTASLFNGVESTMIRITPLADVEIYTGVNSAGTGNETGIAQVVADTLGCELSCVRVFQGDTRISPNGSGNYSSRSVTMGGAAGHLAAVQLRGKLLRVAGNMLGVAESELTISQGHIHPACAAPGTGSPSLTFGEAVAEVYLHPHGPHMENVEPGLEAIGHYRTGNVYHQPDKQGRFSTYPTWSNASAAAVVEVDAETGMVKVLRFVLVHDSGTIVNPLLADAQLQGGITQGIGAALYEAVTFNDGRTAADSFMNYTIPTSKEAVVAELGHHTSPSPFTHLGTKGVGESGISSPPGAIASAIEDALSSLRIRLTHAPFTPTRVWQAIQDAEAASASH